MVFVKKIGTPISLLVFSDSTLIKESLCRLLLSPCIFYLFFLGRSLFMSLLLFGPVLPSQTKYNPPVHPKWVLSTDIRLRSSCSSMIGTFPNQFCGRSVLFIAHGSGIPSLPELRRCLLLLRRHYSLPYHLLLQTFLPVTSEPPDRPVVFFNPK